MIASKKVKNRKRKNLTTNVIQNGKTQKVSAHQVGGSIDESVDERSIDPTLELVDQDEIEEELKTSGSFNMKKFREKLKSGDFITGM